MKIIKHNTYSKYLILLIILILTISACYQYPELDDIQYEDYRRVIGPEGGIIDFYENYENDSVKDVLVKMEFPKNALDSFVVFNMYEFNDLFASNDLINLDVFVNTQFLYFVPFYESFGYNEQTQDSVDYHLSIDFNHPVRITYNINDYIMDEDAKLYRINIPGLNQWEENIWVHWNYQGYPDGYDNIDLVYLITGRWSEEFDWSDGELSLANWEEVTDFTYDNINGTVIFDINNTDYMYVMAYFTVI